LALTKARKVFRALQRRLSTEAFPLLEEGTSKVEGEAGVSLQIPGGPALEKGGTSTLPYYRKEKREDAATGRPITI